VFQGNPTRFDIDDYVARYPELIYWDTPRHAKEISVGDRAFLWRSGLNAGAIAIETVVEPPTAGSTVLHPEALGNDLWRSDETDPEEAKTGIHLDEVASLKRMGMSLGVQLRATLTSPKRPLSPHPMERSSLWIASRRQPSNASGACQPAAMFLRPLPPRQRASEHCARSAGASAPVPCEIRDWLKFEPPMGNVSVPFAELTKQRNTHRRLGHGSSKFITWRHYRRPQRLCVQRLPTSRSCASTVTGWCTPRRR
jgi:hypothetical protein